jgi:threonine dehydratase
VRGAANKILQLKNPSKLCTHSSGNHAQAVSYIGLQLGSKCYIVMPTDTPQVKKDAVKHYKAEVIESGPTVPEQEAMSSRIAR